MLEARGGSLVVDGSRDCFAPPPSPPPPVRTFRAHHLRRISSDEAAALATGAYVRAHGPRTVLVSGSPAEVAAALSVIGKADRVGGRVALEI